MNTEMPKQQQECVFTEMTLLHLLSSKVTFFMQQAVRFQNVLLSESTITRFRQGQRQ